jgi:mannose-1-phosphate guanylyltransferase/mannose-6-phosphate isomerase
LIIPVILAGGSGTRLWPLSRKLLPKQLLALTGEQTMLQYTLMRIRGVSGMEEPVVICNEVHRHLIQEQLGAIDVRPAAVFLEPMGKNTAPAVAVAALKARAISEDAMILVLPADHLIARKSAFYSAIETASRHAEMGALTTFGVVPDRPETGYGYIRKGSPAPSGTEAESRGEAEAYIIDQFVEKPDLETAKGYLASGAYCWNSGMFLFGAKSVWEELARFAPDIAATASDAYLKATAKEGAFRLDEESFGRCRADSIDYAVMEKTERGVMIPFEAGWDDLGSWASLWSVGEKDSQGNFTRGDVIAVDVRDSLVCSTHRLVAGVGLRGHVVVETPDAVLVSSMESAQAVKQIVDNLKESGRKEAAAHLRIQMPWGEAETFLSGDGETIRRIHLSARSELSFTGHGHERLSWMVLSGAGSIFVDGGETKAVPDTLCRLDKDTRIRLVNSGDAPLVVLEVISGMDETVDHLLG